MPPVTIKMFIFNSKNTVPSLGTKQEKYLSFLDSFVEYLFLQLYRNLCESWSAREGSITQWTIAKPDTLESPVLFQWLWITNRDEVSGSLSCMQISYRFSSPTVKDLHAFETRKVLLTHLRSLLLYITPFEQDYEYFEGVLNALQNKLLLVRTMIMYMPVLKELAQKEVNISEEKKIVNYSIYLLRESG